MKTKHIKQINEAIIEKADGFWTDEDDEGNNNLPLFTDIVEAIEKTGFTLIVVPIDENNPETNWDEVYPDDPNTCMCQDPTCDCDCDCDCTDSCPGLT